MQHSAPALKQLVLVGGGHAHALVIRRWAIKPLPGVRMVLVSPNWQTPYSGMLPGLLAGHYTPDDVHIDLRRLCRWAGVRFIEDSVEHINRDTRQLTLRKRGQLDYDLMSLDIGSTPDRNLPGLREHAETVKPIDRFYPRFLALIERCKQAPQPLSIAVVGGGAGGVEVVLALAQRLRQQAVSAQLTLVIRDNRILTDYPGRAAAAARRALHDAGVSLLRQFHVAEVKAGELLAKSGETLAADEAFFCTHARAADWLAGTGLDIDERGFVKVDRHLRSLNTPNIFAAGDIAAMVENPRPKAGVYAVRQAPVLLENLRRSLLGKTLKTYTPQGNFLSLLSLGGKKALACKSPFTLTAPLFQGLLWRWKSRIDCRFMALFTRLPAVRVKRANTASER
ncbi:MAG: FAD-dependent oxidoreductase [Porticoccaceae bacterium]|nr:FAD-dependent oxidoreductase [Porticoccaceae bacterium]